MRKLVENQFEDTGTRLFGVTLIEDVKFDIRSRDEVTKTLRGLQVIYINKECREKVFVILEEMMSEGKSREIGRKGMALWTIFVLGMLRLSCNWNYDRVKDNYDNHQLIRQMCGVDLFCNYDKVTSLQTIHDNISLFTEEIANKISSIVVEYGHKLLKKKYLNARCDSFVCLSNVHFPTDFNLLLNVSNVLINDCSKLSEVFQISGWREHKSLFLKIKQIYNKLSKMRYSNSKNEKVKEKRQKAIHDQIQEYLNLVQRILIKAEKFNENINNDNIKEKIEYGKLFMSQIKRRTFNDETIPSDEKVYSIFEPYTEWICKGKAGVRQELGLKVCIMEDQCGFILHHKVMQNEQDKDVAIEMVSKSKELFPYIKSVSFDKGFHSKNDDEGKNNRIRIEEELQVKAFLPKKGRRNKLEQERESTKEFVKARKQHPAVESAINALETHGLDRCPDKGEDNYMRYVAMAITAANIHKLGAILIKKELSLLSKKSA